MGDITRAGITGREIYSPCSPASCRAENPDTPRQEPTLTVDSAEFDWNELYTGLPLQDEMRKRAQKGPGDCREALQLKDEIQRHLKRIEMQTTSIENALQHYKTGTHQVGRTMELTILLTDEGNTTMRLAKKDGSYSETTVYDPRNPYDFLYTKKDGEADSSLRRHGDSIEAKEPTGEVSVFRIEKGRLLSRKSTDDGFTEYTLNEDGSLQKRQFTGTGKGAQSIASTLMAADENRRQVHAFVHRYSSVLDGKGTRGSLEEDQTEILISALSCYPAGTCRKFEAEGVTIAVADRTTQPPGGYPGMEGWPLDSTGMSPAAGYYDSTHKVIVLAGDVLDKDLVVHEAAHTLDDILAPDGVRFWGLGGKKINHQSSGDKKLKRLYRECKERSRKEEPVWSSYSLCNVQEYYAEGLKFYLGTPVQREALNRQDPGMYEYLAENLHSLK